MSKERLEKAKKILNHIKGYGVYDGNDEIEIFEWLIEQAERVEELEKERNHYKSILSELKILPVHMTKGQYVSRALKIINRALKKWKK